MGFMDSLLNSLEKNGESVMHDLKQQKQKYTLINPVTYTKADKTVQQFYRATIPVNVYLKSGNRTKGRRAKISSKRALRQGTKI